jgi:hypothetical protein
MLETSAVHHEPINATTVLQSGPDLDFREHASFSFDKARADANSASGP